MDWECIGGVLVVYWWCISGVFGGAGPDSCIMCILEVYRMCRNSNKCISTCITQCIANVLRFLTNTPRSTNGIKVIHVIHNNTRWNTVLSCITVYYTEYYVVY